MLLHEENARRELNKIVERFNMLSSDSGAAGNLNFRIQKPEANGEKWEVYVEGQISNGQDNDGGELWKSPELKDYYSGETLADIIEQIRSDVKIYYGDKW